MIRRLPIRLFLYQSGQSDAAVIKSQLGSNFLALNIIGGKKKK